MLHKILFASTNMGKCGEVKTYAKSAGVTVLSPSELHVESLLDSPPDVVEDADTYLGNARLKSKGYFEWGKMPALADDSGLEVAALDGAPGLYTARYAGVGCTPLDNIRKLLGALKGVEDRRAVFHCSLSLCLDGESFTEVSATFPGNIAYDLSGEGGFGYDPIFIPDGYEETLAALKARGEDIETHRILALKRFFKAIA